jgi:hypothetical protein
MTHQLDHSLPIKDSHRARAHRLPCVSLASCPRASGNLSVIQACVANDRTITPCLRLSSLLSRQVGIHPHYLLLNMAQ